MRVLIYLTVEALSLQVQSVNELSVAIVGVITERLIGAGEHAVKGNISLLLHVTHDARSSMCASVHSAQL